MIDNRIIPANISALFFFSTVNIKSRYFDYKNNNLKNAFYKKTNDEDFEYLLYVLFQPNDNEIFNQFLLEEYDQNENLLEDFKIDNGIILVYKLDENLKEDFELIINSKYSKISKEFQALLPKALKIIESGLHKDELSPQMKIVKKSPEYREMWEQEIGYKLSDDDEVWTGFDDNYEILENYLKLNKDEFRTNTEKIS